MKKHAWKIVLLVALCSGIWFTQNAFTYQTTTNCKKGGFNCNLLGNGCAVARVPKNCDGDPIVITPDEDDWTP